MKPLSPRLLAAGGAVLVALGAGVAWWAMPSLSDSDVAALNQQVAVLKRAESVLYATWLQDGGLTAANTKTLPRSLQSAPGGPATLSPYGGALLAVGRGNAFVLQVTQVPKRACEYLAYAAFQDFVSIEAVPSPRQFDRLMDYFPEAPSRPSTSAIADLMEGHAAGRLLVNKGQAKTAKAASALCRSGGNTLRWSMAFPDENAALLEKMGLSRSFAPEE